MKMICLTRSSSQKVAEGYGPSIQKAELMADAKSQKYQMDHIRDIVEPATINLEERDLFNGVMAEAANNISNLLPLADLTNLQALGLEGNNISNLSPLAGLTNLHDLRLAGNNISNLSPLSSLTDLHAFWTEMDKLVGNGKKMASRLKSYGIRLY
ncbi:leucine-rich repeat domain-containing protein [Chloroflexota bacterium]